jgi:regulatory protein
MAWCEASPTISRVTRVPRKNEYVVELSDGSSIRALEEHLSVYALEEGNSISQDVVFRITTSYEYGIARQVAMRLLKTRPRTEHELLRRFRRQGIRSNISKQVLDDLRAEGLVNDRLFAQLWIKEKVGRGTCGKRRISMDLKSKGIDETVVEEELALNYDDDHEAETARRFAERRMARLKSVPPGTRSQRIYNLLLRHGFRRDLARAAVESAQRNMEAESQ